jgi:hypothetical protein
MKRLLLLGLTCVLFAGCVRNYSTGERVGIITKLSEKGLIFKSWEASMLIALPIEVAGTTQPETFEFNVDESVVDNVKDAIEKSKRVKVYYRQWLMPPPTIDNAHVAIKIEDIKK